MATTIPSYGLTTVISIMEHKVYDKFSEADDGLAWSLIQEDAARQLLGRHVIAVPSLNFAEKFDLLSVYAKGRQKLVDKVKRKCPTYVYIGKLGEILMPGAVDRQILNYLEDAQIERERCAETARYKQSDLREGLRKTIEIDSGEVEKAISFLCIPENVGRLVVNRSWCPVLREAKHIYIINEVYSAKNLRLITRVGAVENVTNFPERTPVGFNYLKVGLLSDGALGDARESTKTGRKADWLYDLPPMEELNCQEYDNEAFS